MNEVHITGNLARDPIIRSTKTGKQVASFTVAVNENYTSPTTGEVFQKTSWVNVVAWERIAEAVGAKLKKGSRVTIDGKINTRSYDTPDEQRHWVTEVVANTVTVSIVDPRPNNGTNGSYYGAGQQHASGYSNQAPSQGYSGGAAQSQQGFSQFGPARPDPENQPQKEQTTMFPENGPQSDEEIPF